MKINCSKCGDPYVFSDKWAKKHNKKTFVCRGCKIRASWTPEKREEAREKSKAMLSSQEVKTKMSMMATISNAKNSEKISISLKKYFKENKKVASTPKAESISKISNSIKEKWQDDEYRAKILLKRWEKQDSTLFKLTAKERKIKNALVKAGIPFIMNKMLGAYEFKFLVNDKILIDTDPDERRKLFVEHYFEQYEYRTSWK